MSSRINGHHELLKLLEAVCEDRLSADQGHRLESLLSDDAEARKFYREYMLLHGTLYWDTAIETDSLIGQQLTNRKSVQMTSQADFASKKPSLARRVIWTVGVVSAMALISAVILTGDLFPKATDQNIPGPIAENTNSTGNPPGRPAHPPRTPNKTLAFLRRL